MQSSRNSDARLCNKAWTDTPIMTVAETILTEIENRLYPEYDGETVTVTEHGWMTPEGEIRYDN